MRDFSHLSAELFGRKVQKISIDAGFSCPNRDGTKGRGGCTYCNVSSFTPGYCNPSLSVSEQLSRGKEFFRRKHPDTAYLAYFQSYTSTLADIDRLMGLYKEALADDDVVGLVIGTRPDCIDADLAEALTTLGKPVIVELGAETSHDHTLKLVNRHHTWAQTVSAIETLHKAGLTVGVHLIMGLPGESRDDMLATIDTLNGTAVDVVKVHQLQLLKGTTLARQVERGEVSVTFPTMEEYMELCVEIVKHLDPRIAVDRFVSTAPQDMLIAPRWGLKNYQFTHLLVNRLRQLGY